MIWSIFKRKKEPHVLINELTSVDENLSKQAYRDLLDYPNDECDNLLLITLNSQDTIKEKKLAIISILGHRAVIESIPTLKKIIKNQDNDLKLGAIEALFNIGLSECIDELVKNLTIDNDIIKQKIVNFLSRLPVSDTMGSLLRCVPEDKNSQLYFEIVSVMEELNIFEVLKDNFGQPDPLIKEFYFSSIIKFNRSDFIPLYLDYYPSASNKNKDIILELLKDYDFKELLNYFTEYIKRNGNDGLNNLIDIVIIPRHRESILETLKFVIIIKDTKYKIKTLSNLLRHIDPYCYETVFELLNDSSNELRDFATNCLIDLIRKTHKRILDPNEPNVSTLKSFFSSWEKQITHIMQIRNGTTDDYCKAARKIFFEFCCYNHELIKPFFIEFVNKDFFETYYYLKDWSFDDKFDIYCWLIKTEPSFGSIILSSLNARADETLWRLAIKLSNSFNEEEDSNVFRKNLVTRHHNISIEKYLRDDDPGIRAASIEIYSQMKISGYVDILKSYAKDPSPVVRKAAIKSLLNDHNINIDRFALESLDDPDEDIVLFVLQKLKSRFNTQKLSPYLVRFLNSESQELRNYVKQEIGTISKDLYKANYNNMKPEMRKLAAQAIQKIDTSFTDEIINDLRSFDPQTRLRAALLLENIQLDAKRQETLIAAMKDPSKKVRAAIVKTLGIVGDKETIKYLINCFNDPDTRVRANTIEAIASLGDNTVTRILFPFLEDSNNRIRANAIVGICKFGKYNVMAILQNMLTDKETNMRASALWAIGEIGEPMYIQLTYPFVQDQNELIRFNAIKAISRINPQLLSPYMMILRKDSSQKIRNLVKDLSYKLI